MLVDAANWRVVSDIDKTQPAERTKDGSPVSKWVAKILDDLIRIPGTNKKIGLDPLIGLIPGVGDFATSTAGLALLVTGAKKKVPKSVYLRMGANWALNSIVGAIPVVGDVFSFWYKSNRRNYALLKANADDVHDPKAENRGWAPVFILLGFVVFVFTMIGLAAWWGARLIFG